MGWLSFFSLVAWKAARLLVVLVVAGQDLFRWEWRGQGRITSRGLGCGYWISVMLRRSVVAPMTAWECLIWAARLRGRVGDGQDGQDGRQWQAHTGPGSESCLGGDSTGHILACRGYPGAAWVFWCRRQTARVGWRVTILEQARKLYRRF